MVYGDPIPGPVASAPIWPPYKPDPVVTCGRHPGAIMRRAAQHGTDKVYWHCDDCFAEIPSFVITQGDVR